MPFKTGPSTFYTTCVCGAPIVTMTRETKCKSWGRLAEIHWPADLEDCVKVEQYDTRQPLVLRAA